MRAHVQTEKLAFVGSLVTHEEWTKDLFYICVTSTACVLSLTLQCGEQNISSDCRTNHFLRRLHCQYNLRAVRVRSKSIHKINCPAAAAERTSLIPHLSSTKLTTWGVSRSSRSNNCACVITVHFSQKTNRAQFVPGGLKCPGEMNTFTQCVCRSKAWQCRTHGPLY